MTEPAGKRKWGEAVLADVESPKKGSEKVSTSSPSNGFPGRSRALCSKERK